jgi:glycosyltransferase involved in cell wall biosynthesis
MYVHTPYFYIRPRNTDWLYTQLLARLTEFNPNLQVYLQHSFFASLAENLRKAADIIEGRTRIPVPVSLLAKQDSHFSRRDVRRARPDFIYGQAPTNIPDIPLVFNCGPTFPDVLRKAGASEAFIARELKVKRRCAARASLIVSHSRSNLDNLALIMPDQVAKMRCLPFFLPHLNALPEAEIEKKFSDTGKIRLLFIGREARRKGLPETLVAFQQLSAKFPSRLHLKIVTNFADGAVEIPAHPDIELLGETSRDDVQRLLEQSHILLVPSRFESYGWVYLEAMAAGCITIAADGATQREILDDGHAGFAVGANPEKIVDTLTPFLALPEIMLPQALAAQRHCASEYLPQAIAKRFEELGREAIELFQSSDKKSRR